MNKLTIFLSVTLLVLASSCKHKQSNKAMPAVRVEIQKANIDSLYDRITVANQIAGLNNAVIQPRVNGFLIATHYQGGAPVEKGDLLFTIDPSTFATSLYAAQAAVESAHASEILAQRNYERAAPLAQIDAISKSDLDQYRASYKAARAKAKSAEESLREAELQIGYTKIYAPISGIAAKTTAAVGDYIGPGTLQNELTTISQLDTITVDIAIPAARYLKYIDNKPSGSFNNAHLLSNITMTLTDSSAYALPGEYYYTRKDTPASSSTVVVVAKFPNPSLTLKEGMFARVSANIGSRRAAILVPSSAVSQLQGVNSVWVVSPDSIAQWRTVELGNTNGKEWEITSGIEAGEMVVAKGALKLHNGVKVTTAVGKK